MTLLSISSSLTIPFVKMHGLGNDFIVVNKENLPIDFDIKNCVKNVAQRHTGIGCDQFIVYSRINGGFEMQIYNADGSIAEVCGNASRCLARLYFEQTNIPLVKLQVQDRIINCEMTNKNGIAVNMGIASFAEAWMPSATKIRNLISPYNINMIELEIMCVDIGNPHLVLFVNDISTADMQLLGSKLEQAVMFPNRVNVNFVKIVQNIINLKVWERGTGFTLACGSGACASFAAAHALGFVNDEAEVNFELGTLILKYKNREIIMTGSAPMVAKGEFYYEC